MSEPCRFDSKRPYSCQTHNTQWLDDDADQCEYKRMVVAEAQVQAVQEVCKSAIAEFIVLDDDSTSRAGMANRILRILDGERDE